MALTSSTPSRYDETPLKTPGSAGPPPSTRLLATVHALRSEVGDGAFHLDQAESIGISADRVQRACAAGLLIRVGRGWYAVASNEHAGGLDVASRARLEALGDAANVVLCGTSAAAVWGLPLPPGVPTPCGLELLASDPDAPWGGRRPYETVRRWKVPGRFIVDGPHGGRLTDPLQTALDLGRGLTMPFALPALDAAMRLTQGLAHGPEEVRHLLLDRAIAAHGSRRMREALRAVPFADPRAESPLESIVRGRVIEAGLPTPAMQVPVVGVSGRHYRADLGMRIEGDSPGTTRLLIEADGMLKYADARDLVEEKRRQHDLESNGYRIVRVLYTEGVRSPGNFLATVRRCVEAPRRSG